MLGLSVMHLVPVLPSPLGWESAGNLPNSVTRKLMKTNKAEACCEHLHTLTPHMLDAVLGNYIGYNILWVVTVHIICYEQFNIHVHPACLGLARLNMLWAVITPYPTCLCHIKKNDSCLKMWYKRSLPNLHYETILHHWDQSYKHHSNFYTTPKIIDTKI